MCIETNLSSLSLSLSFSSIFLYRTGGRTNLKVFGRENFFSRVFCFSFSLFYLFLPHFLCSQKREREKKQRETGQSFDVEFHIASSWGGFFFSFCLVPSLSVGGRDSLVVRPFPVSSLSLSSFLIIDCRPCFRTKRDL